MPPKARTRRGFGRIRRLPSGRYQAAFVGPDNALHKAATTFALEIQAKDWLLSEQFGIQDAKSRGKPWLSPAARVEAAAEQEKVLFGQYARDVIANRPKQTKRTYGTYESLLRIHVNPTFELVAVVDITPKIIREWYRTIKPVRATTTTGQFETTKRRAAELLRMVLNTAVEDEILATSPFKLKLDSLRPDEIKFLSLEDVDRLADALPDRLAAAALLAGYCGIRRGELFELRRKDFNADCSRVQVLRQVQHRSAQTWIVPPKSGSKGDVVTPSNIRERLVHHLAEHVGRFNECLLFPAETGTDKHMTEWAFRKHWVAALEAIGKPGHKLHGLRHAAAVAAAQAGGTQREIQARLRHSTSAAAARYQHVAAGRDEWLADRIAEMSKEAR